MLDSYFAVSEDRQRQLRATKPSDARARTLLKHMIPVRYRGTGRVILTDLVRPRERLKARLVSGQPLMSLRAAPYRRENSRRYRL